MKAVVYFLACPAAGAVKVGWAADLHKRIVDHQCGCPLELELLASFPGDVRTEKRLHLALTGAGIRGEWFQAAAVDALLEDAQGNGLAWAIERRLRLIADNRAQLQAASRSAVAELRTLLPELSQRSRGLERLTSALCDRADIRDAFQRFMNDNKSLSAENLVALAKRSAAA